VQPNSGFARQTRACSRALTCNRRHNSGMSTWTAPAAKPTHGAKPNQSGKWSTPSQYGVAQGRQSARLMDQVEALAKAQPSPKMIIAGGSAILAATQKIDFKRMRDSPDMVGAYLARRTLAHFAGPGCQAGNTPLALPPCNMWPHHKHTKPCAARARLILPNDEALAKSSTRHTSRHSGGPLDACHRLPKRGPPFAKR